ncbi:cdc42 effector protein 5 [Narcine bancroftii]|uniref:cdc42 effector protein 5 n=1 Tax=Narcine bancroftii TaxID=1343680 RepID=UPI003831B458
MPLPKQRRTGPELTREMISSPMGDFRHTMHVGRAGEVFGDTSFLRAREGESDGWLPCPAERKGRLDQPQEEEGRLCQPAVEQTSLPRNWEEEEEGGMLPRTGDEEERLPQHEEGASPDPQLPTGGSLHHAESILSFQVDLGPSMLGEVLGVMEKEPAPSLGYSAKQEGEGVGRGSSSTLEEFKGIGDDLEDEIHL